MTVGQAPQSNHGKSLQDANWLLGLAGGNNQFSQTVTATPGGAQAGSVVIGSANSQGIEAVLVEVGTVASANDSVQLPQAIAGKSVLVYNSSATAASLFANTATNKATGALDTINGVANGTAYGNAGGLTAKLSVLFFCPRNGIWAALKSA